MRVLGQPAWKWCYVGGIAGLVLLVLFVVVVVASWYYGF